MLQLSFCFEFGNASPRRLRAPPVAQLASVFLGGGSSAATPQKREPPLPRPWPGAASAPLSPTHTNSQEKRRWPAYPRFDFTRLAPRSHHRPSATAAPASLLFARCTSWTCLRLGLGAGRRSGGLRDSQAAPAVLWQKKSLHVLPICAKDMTGLDSAL